MSGLAIIIPARYGSTRFEGKPLAPICGRPLIQHVYERAMRAKSAGQVIVATDDERIFKAVERFGGKVMMTKKTHETGTHRVAEVAESMESEWIINLQGDEPLIDPEVIDMLGNTMFSSPEEKMFSLMRPLSGISEFLNPNVVKVVVNQKGQALYFSRAPIPYPRGFSLQGIESAFNAHYLDESLPENVHIHCGIYGYRKDFLLSIPFMHASPLEYIEGLEQLRILANGYMITMVSTSYRSVGVDTPEDIEIVEKISSCAMSP